MNLYLDETNIFGQYLYRVMIDGERYDHFISDRQLTWSQMVDVEEGYREALSNYVKANEGLV